jgi:6-pyruvoyltetrahydropterin/6-carboxytetrahydropterin synthase
MELAVDFNFSAAHRLPYYDGPCNRVHGHNYRLRVTIRGRPDPATGMLMDFEELRARVQARVLEAVDHRLLNDLVANPTAENLVVWVWGRLVEALPGLVQLELWETPSYKVIYRGD